LLSENSAEAILHYNVSGTQPPKSRQYEAIKILVTTRALWIRVN